MSEIIFEFPEVPQFNFLIDLQGASLYQKWLELGNDGDYADFLDWLRIQGETGMSAYELAVSLGFSGTETQWLESLVGKVSRTIIPSDSPLVGEVGKTYWYAVVAGTYTNFGGVVVNPNSLAIIMRNDYGTFSITQTTIPQPENKINPWIAQSYASGSQVNYLGKLWESNADTISTDIPGVSGRWIEKLTGYVGYNSDNDDFIIKDEDGNIALSIDKDGVFEIAKLGAGTVALIKAAIGSSSATPDTLIKTKINFIFADINHVVTYGQSLSVGQTEAVISTEPVYGNLLTFGNSVLTSAYSEDYPANLGSFGPLKERTYTTTPLLNETPTTGTCEKLYKDILSSSFSYDKRLKILGSAPGQGATTVAQLSKGTSYYSRVIADVTAGKNNSESLGKTYKCYAVTWTQGESDYISGTSKSAYKTALKQLSIDLNNDIKVITGQSEDIRFITYQTATISDYAETPTIALAQYELSIENDNIIEMGTSMYFMEYNDNFHLKAVYSKLLGIYYGKALSQEFFKPIYPIGHLIKGNNIELVFNVPQKPLVFESLTTSSTITNQGFEVIKAGVNILTSVELMGDGISIKLLCSESPAGSEIRYAFQKGVTTANKRNMGFLRDSEGVNNQYEIAGVVYNLNNWCPIFNYNL